MPSSKQNAVKVRVKQLEFDSRLLMYFNNYQFIYAADPQRVCKTGDTVLIRNLPKKLTRLITHEVVNVIYKLGDVIDPITGKPVVTGKYRYENEEAAKIYGKRPSAFDYDSAPPRGTQEDKRDFTHKKAYVKHYNDPDDPQPYALVP